MSRNYDSPLYKDMIGKTVAVRYKKTGQIDHKDATEVLDHNTGELDKVFAGYMELVETKPDGFRKRRKRTKADMKQLIKDGVVADPAVGVPERVPGENEAVVDVPLARVTADKE
jgi:hypothetical protein